jgi:hypothetical protein
MVSQSLDEPMTTPTWMAAGDEEAGVAVAGVMVCGGLPVKFGFYFLPFKPQVLT